MRQFQRHRGIAAPLIRNNIDTDAIIPSVEMKRVSKKGLSEGLFAAWRYSDRAKRTPNPEFILNQAAYAGASILLGGENFGCGSSREHAIWALDEFGIRVIIAPSFGGIFYANCIANGLLPVRLAAQDIEQLADFVARSPQENRVQVDLPRRSITAGDLAFAIDIAEADAEMLLNGWDPISLTLRVDGAISEFIEGDKAKRPWIYLSASESR